MPTTNTPFVYSFTPAKFPTGITLVFGNTLTSTSLINNLLKRLTSIFVTPTLSDILFEVLADVSNVLLSLSILKRSPNIEGICKSSPSNKTILSGKYPIAIV